jgi:hypothetical protein
MANPTVERLLVIGSVVVTLVILWYVFTHLLT